jgi:hypothetical protein
MKINEASNSKTEIIFSKKGKINAIRIALQAGEESGLPISFDSNGFRKNTYDPL